MTTTDEFFDGDHTLITADKFRQRTITVDDNLPHLAGARPVLSRARLCEKYRAFLVGSSQSVYFRYASSFPLS